MLSSKFKKINSFRSDHDRTRSLMREAFKKHPESIESLKRSLSINHTNLSQFVKYIKEPPQPHSLTNVDNLECKRLSQIRKVAIDLQNQRKVNKQDIFFRKCSKKGGHLRRQLKIQNSNRKLEKNQQNRFFVASDNFNQLRKDINSKLAFNNEKRESIPIGRVKTQMNKTCAINMFDNNQLGRSSSTQRFWKRNGKSYSHTEARWKTETDQKHGNHALGQLTKFDLKQHRKGLNYLILQLQFNIQHAKKSHKRLMQ